MSLGQAYDVLAAKWRWLLIWL